MEFGFHHNTFEEADTSHFQGVLRMADFLESNDFSWYSFPDHYQQIPFAGEQDDAYFDCYTMLPAVAAETDEIELGACVTCAQYRNPAVLAKIMTTLDHVSDGRAVLGIGAGWYQDEFDAIGFEFPAPADRVRRMVETIEAAKRLWTEESPVSYDGEYYEIADLYHEPKPVQDPHPPVMIGGSGEKLTLRAVAELADRWNAASGEITADVAEQKLGVLADHCESVGRDIDDIQKSVFNNVVVRETDDTAHDAYERLQSSTETGPAARGEPRGLVGSAATVTGMIEAYDDLGFDQLIFKVPKGDDETLERFIGDVKPAFD